MSPKKLFFVVMEGVSAQRAVYEVSFGQPPTQATLSKKMLVGGRGTNLLFSDRRIVHVEVEKSTIAFFEPGSIVGRQLIAAFGSLDAACACCSVGDLVPLDGRWIFDTEQRLTELREMFPSAQRCHGGCGQCSCQPIC